MKTALYHPCTRLQLRERGATAAEYALMVSFIAIAIIVAVLTLGNRLSSFFLDASTQI